MGVRVDSREWLLRLERVQRELDSLEDVHARAAGVIGTAARPPVRTGRLAASRSIDTRADVAVLSWDAPYAGFVHYGTRYMPARPFATDAADQVDGRLTALYTEQLDNLLRT